MALQTITEIDLDINQPGLAVVHAKQYDTVRQVKANLFYNGVKWLVPSSNFVAVVGFKKADRIGGFYDTTEDSQTAVTVDSNDRSIIYILLDRNVVTTEGDVNTEITFYDAVTKGRLSTFSFVTQVEGATVTELDLASNPYFNILAEDIKLVIEAAQSMTGLSATAIKLAPDADPTVTVTGGTSAEDPYVFNLGLPSMPAVTVSASQLAPDATPTAVITGGQTAGQAYNVEFGIPKGDKGDTAQVTSVTYQYAISTSGSTPPSSSSSDWKNDISQIPIEDRKGKVLWTKQVTTWSNGYADTEYTATYNGGDATGAVISINGRDGVVTLQMSDLFTSVGPI